MEVLGNEPGNETKWRRSRGKLVRLSFPMVQVHLPTAISGFQQIICFYFHLWWVWWGGRMGAGG